MSEVFNFLEFPMVKQIAGEGNSLYSQGGAPTGINVVEGEAFADPAQTALLASRDSVINEVSVGMSGYEGAMATAFGTPPLSLPNSLGKPLTDWKVDLLPYQEGTGDPAPDNVRPIHGTDKVTVWTAGKNLLDINRTEIIDTYEEGGSTAATTPRTFTENQIWIGLAFNNYFNPNRVDSYEVTSDSVKMQCNSTAYGIGFPIKCAPNMQFTVSHSANIDAYVGVVYYDANGSLISYVNRTYVSITYTIPSNCAWMCIVLCPSAGTEVTYNNLQVEFGNTASEYVPFDELNAAVITLPQTIYSGSVSDNGAVSNWGEVDLGTLDWGASTPSNHVFRSNSLQGWIVPTSSSGEVTSAICEQFAPMAYGPISASDNGKFAVADDGSSARGRIVFIDHRWDSIDDFKTAVSGVKFVYPLINPTEFAVSTPTIPTPSGNATIWATAEDGLIDSMDVTYVGKA